jgi:orotate phosphoribosyltransferase
MSSPHDFSATAFLALVSGTQGHFLLESGYHTSLWLDLDTLFANPRRIAPWVARLAVALRPYDVSVVCGAMVGGAFLAQLLATALDIECCFAQRTPCAPDETATLFSARYHVPPVFGDRLRGARAAVVDDVMSAGSAMRGAYAALRDRDAIPIVVGALGVLGSIGSDFFAARDVPLEAVVRHPFHVWAPVECPLCAAGVALRDPRGHTFDAL